MRIERIRIKNFIGLGDWDWIFPLGPTLILFEDKFHHKLFRELYFTIFYNQKKSLLLGTEQRQKGFVEVWISGEGLHFHIRHEFIQKNDQLERFSTLIDETGQIVCLPETMTLGEYLFKVQLEDFLLGGSVDWPESDHHDLLLQRISNLRQGGDEGLSLAKVRASIAGGQKRVQEQKESMSLVKAEYDALRREWEIVHRQQDDVRMLNIDIKNLREREAVLTERIASTASMQKRLELLSQNPDYRELRRLQDELKQLEERLRCLDVNIKDISSESNLNWAVIKSLHKECMEWAYLQKNVGRIISEALIRAKQIEETKNFLRKSGYQELLKDEDQLLRRALEERDAAQEKLDKLIIIKRQLKKLQYIYSQEVALFEKFAAMVDVTLDDEIKFAQKEKHLELWRSFKLSSALDRTLRNRFGMTSVSEMLSSRLLQEYKRYQVSNYQEFSSQHKKFIDQQKRVKRVNKLMEKLQVKVSQEKRLCKIVHSSNDILKKAFTAVHAVDFQEWLDGWENYQQKKYQLSVELEEMHHLEVEQQPIEEKKLAECAEKLRENLANWGIPSTDREEALAEVLKVAIQLRERDEVEREVAVLSEIFYRLRGDRNMEQLSKSLEPLAELEREKCIPYEDRLTEISTWDNEQVEIRQHLANAKQRLQSMQKFSSLSVLERKIELMKHQWMAYEDLRKALDDAQVLLELSWQEWQTKHEKRLREEKQWVFDHCFSPPTQNSLEGETVVKMDYFSYRMAVSQLALGNNTEAPLLFSVGIVRNIDKNFWGEVTEYFYKLSSSRQVILSTTDPNLRELLSGRDWSLLALPRQL